MFWLKCILFPAVALPCFALELGSQLRNHTQCIEGHVAVMLCLAFHTRRQLLCWFSLLHPWTVSVPKIGPRDRTSFFLETDLVVRYSFSQWSSGSLNPKQNYIKLSWISRSPAWASAPLVWVWKISTVSCWALLDRNWKTWVSWRAASLTAISSRYFKVFYSSLPLFTLVYSY